MLSNHEKTMEKIVSLCKNRGFVYPGSEIYGGLANTWDYGPLGVELKNNVKKAWLAKSSCRNHKYNVGLDSAIADESAGMGGIRTCGRILRSADGLQGLQNPPSCRST